MVNNQNWKNGQEGELGEMEGLKDTDGNIWVLVSGPIGCREGEEEPAEEVSVVAPPSLEKGKAVEVAKGDESAADEEDHEEEHEEGSWLREVVIETLSKDQGWSSTDPAAYGESPRGFCSMLILGTYDSSYSWFDITLLREGKEVPDSRKNIQHNVHGG